MHQFWQLRIFVNPGTTHNNTVCIGPLLLCFFTIFLGDKTHRIITLIQFVYLLSNLNPNSP